MVIFKQTEPVADPGFTRRVKGEPSPKRGANLLFGKTFAKNCMKLTEIGVMEGTFLTPPWIR